MKVLWLVNIKMPAIDIAKNKEVSCNIGGWLTGLYENIYRSDEVDEIIICYPVSKKSDDEEFVCQKLHAIPFCNNKGCEKFFEDVLKRCNPAVIHIHGTEFRYALDMVNAAVQCGTVNKVLCSIQGLVGVYALHFYAMLPHCALSNMSLWEVIKKQTLQQQKRDYEIRGKYEAELLKRIKHVVGRTSWDKACAWWINPELNYHHCNEILRKGFYNKIWKYDNCEPHTIMLSQGAKPIKGLHIVVDAIRIIKERYPDVKVYVAGANLREIYKHNSYAKYILKIISCYGLEENFVFTGGLSEIEMCERMIKCNAFVLPSSIENSPNSLGEAMLMGLPCIASDVGGVCDMMTPNVEGLIYPYDEFYKLAYYIMSIFEMKEYAEEMGHRAVLHARETHDAEVNSMKTIELYKMLAK